MWKETREPLRWQETIGSPDYHVIHSSIVLTNANFLQALRGEGPAETTGEDNVKTLKLVYAAYESARGRKAVNLG